MDKNKELSHAEKRIRLQKDLLSKLATLIFLFFLFRIVHVPSFVFYIVALSMGIGIVRQGIDLYYDERKNKAVLPPPEEDFFSEEGFPDLELREPVKQEWKDSDFV